MRLQSVKLLCAATLIFYCNIIGQSQVEALEICTFENQNWCGYTQDNLDEFDWTIHSGSTGTIGTGPLHDHTLQNSDGYYIYTEASPRSLNDATRILSPLIRSRDGGECTVQFWYHMYGIDIGTLNVYIKTGDHSQLCWTRSGNGDDSWHFGTFYFPTPDYYYQVIFEGIRGTGLTGDIALDDIEIPERVDAFEICTFENQDWCGYTQESLDEFDWTMHSGSTSSYNTGPAYDHTLQNAAGYYIYTEVSIAGSTHDKARIISPQIPSHGAECIVQFWYHMYGSQIGTLNVYTKAGDDTQLRWTKSGDQGDSWHFVTFSFTSPTHYQVILEGVRGRGVAGDISLDDIEFPIYLNAPVVTGCPDDVKATAELGTYETTVSWIEPTVTCERSITTVRSHEPGTNFPIGETHVAYIYTDMEGRTLVCSFSIIVETVDTTSPTITYCTSSQHTTTELGTNGTTVSWTEPTATDLSGNPNVIRSHVPMTEFPVGVTQVLYQFVDTSNNTATCRFTVTVDTVDTTPPVLSHCPSDVSSVGGRHVSWIEPTAFDHSQSITVVNSHSPGLFLVEDTEVKYSFTDLSGNTEYCHFKIKISVDTTSPVISGCPNDINAESELGSSGTPVYWSQPTATDDNERVMFLHANHTPGETFPVGVSNVQYIYGDDSYNLAFCNFTVIVSEVDSTQPELTNCPLDIYKAIEVGTTSVEVTWDTPSASDKSGFVNLASSSHVSGDMFDVGATRVSYTFADGVNNRIVCDFSVIITEVDTIAPTILSCPNDITTQADPWTFGTNVGWTEPQAEDASGYSMLLVQTHAPETFFAVGTTIVSYVYTDKESNINRCSFWVTVIN